MITEKEFHTIADLARMRRFGVSRTAVWRYLTAQQTQEAIARDLGITQAAVSAAVRRYLTTLHKVRSAT